MGQGVFGLLLRTQSVLYGVLYLLSVSKVSEARHGNEPRQESTYSVKDASFKTYEH